MNRNPVVPFLLILLMGVGLIFFMSAEGANKEKEGAEGGEGAKTEQKFDAAAFAKDNCTSCHGQNLEGAMGPKLAGTSKPADELKKVIREGKGAMPAHDESVIADKDLDTLVKYLKDGAK
ncbi:cytochrome c [Macrococcus hajekii]|uniref:Cytochrome c n=1 Tax=Macrococcus hajekii TaxID=198482 RepID=A0A4R6BM50_9STAP|nr:cytochrome c [Macrococcus hajekii]TDM02890.1 cytochrome c [Macrococcus hajekii]GGB04682.1 cytochrome c-550 [Macrococcus hajekii]